MNQSLLSMGSTRSVENNEFNRLADLKNRDISEQIRKLQKQGSPDTSMNDLQDSLRGAVAGIGASKSLIDLGKKLSSPVETAVKESKGLGLAEIGEVAGIAEGSEALSQDIQGKFKTLNTAEKVGNISDIVSGVADSTAILLPFTAPVTAAIGGVADIVGSVADEIGSDQATKKKAALEKTSKIQNLQGQRLQQKSAPVVSQIGIMATPLKSNSKITGSYGF